MKNNDIILLFVIIAIVVIYGLRKSENLDQTGPTDCKWIDNEGNIRNGDKDSCTFCYKCKNPQTGVIVSRAKCMGGDNAELDMGFDKFHSSKSCYDF
jgi:hypothetical protein